MGLTTNPNDPDLRKIDSTGQQKTYLVLSEDERRKGFVMPVHRSYTHLKCGAVTTMGLALCETYARDPSFYGGTFCCACGAHFPLKEITDMTPEGDYWKHNFEWPDGTPVGCGPEEAERILADRKAREIEKTLGGQI